MSKLLFFLLVTVALLSVIHRLVLKKGCFPKITGILISAIFICSLLDIQSSFQDQAETSACLRCTVLPLPCLGERRAEIS